MKVNLLVLYFREYNGLAMEVIKYIFVLKYNVADLFPSIRIRET